MAKIKYYYDTETCRYERVKTSTTDITFNLMGFLVVSLVMGAGLAWAYNLYFPSEQVASLRRENEQLLLKYDILNKEMAEAGSMLKVLQERDDNLYRAIFEAEPVPLEVRQAGTGGTEKFKALLEERLERQDLILSVFQKIDNLKKQMYVQTKSYDELSTIATKKADMTASIPAIQPVSKKSSTFASGFGSRMHPILKYRKMHTGCDLTAAKGTPVYATGDGKIIRADWHSGYGMTVEIDHGYGYITRYAHLSGYSCRVGQRVKRGQEVGKVGSTGLSVSPHLHYEVHYNGKPVNPVNYFFNDLSPDEYEEILEIAEQDRQSLG